VSNPGHSEHGIIEPDYIASGETLSSVTKRISSIPLDQPQNRFWWIGFGAAFFAVLVLFASLSWVLIRGVGVWGINIPVAWGFAIVNFVWWIGIGHAGTFISAILLLLYQQWRTSINRLTEAMTLFAVACAGIFPLMHLGRPQFFYWLLPYPDTMGLWPQFRSPLVWDVFAVSTYLTVSLVFWYVGLIPDLATLRDRATSLTKRRIYGLLSLGWRGDGRHWFHYGRLYLLLAGLAAPLVVSVHSIVGLDFAIAILPGWHSTIFPPYFVGGAIYSGFSMVLTLVIPLRAVYGLKSMITPRHLDLMAKVMMAMGWVVAYGYFCEFFTAWRSGVIYDRYVAANRVVGPYAPYFWALVVCNICAPQFLWSGTIRHNPISLWVVALFINVGMWIERFIIVITSLHRDFLPSSWGMYHATFWDYSTLFGTIGLFLALIFLFIRFLPMIAISEMRNIVAGLKVES
jgi:molybdopterin-containing oxidoreductase family membrane subunit